MIKIFNSAHGNSEARYIALNEVEIRSQKIDSNGKPYILFDHKDFPLGSLRAEFDGAQWACDLD
jgi:hypothetical protein